METEMLEQQLRASKKETTSLKRRLEAATAALASANISSANPALLRVKKAEGKGGLHRGAGGTPHALALAWAREEAARLSPALVMVSADFEASCLSQAVSRSLVDLANVECEWLLAARLAFKLHLKKTDVWEAQSNVYCTVFE